MKHPNEKTAFNTNFFITSSKLLEVFSLKLKSIKRIDLQMPSGCKLNALRNVTQTQKSNKKNKNWELMLF